MKSEKAKLPKGMSYPFKPSMLEAALAGANVNIDTHLVRGPGELFDAHFWPPNENISIERLYVRAGTVAIAEASDARRKIENEMIPALTDWVRAILAQDRNSPTRREQQYLNLRPFLD